jgi:hypothetical protein
MWTILNIVMDKQPQAEHVVISNRQKHPNLARTNILNARKDPKTSCKKYPKYPKYP